MTTSEDHMKLYDDDDDCRSSFDRATYVQMSSFPRVWVLSFASLSLPMIMCFTKKYRQDSGGSPV